MLYRCCFPVDQAGASHPRIPDGCGLSLFFACL